MHTYHPRPMTEADVPAALAIATATERQSRVGLVCSAEHVRRRYLGPRPGWWGEAVVWERKGAVVAVSAVWADEQREPVELAYLRMLVDPTERFPALGDAIVAWGEGTAAGRYGLPLTMEIPTPLRLTWQVGVIGRHGYKIARRFDMLARDLTGLPDAPALPEGYRLRPFDGARDVDAWLAVYHAAFADHWDFHPLPREARAEVGEEPGWRPDLDLVIEAPDGTLAAFAIAEPRANGEGGEDWEISSVGTAPAHRRRGLAGVLLVELMRRLAAMGADRVRLDVDADSPTGADRLYASLGFALEQTHADFRRRLEG